MKILDVRFNLSERISPLLSGHGFTDRNHDCTFQQKSGEFIYSFKLEVYAKTGWFFTKPLVCIGSSQLNKLYNQILQPKDRLRLNGPTVGLCFGISNEFQGRGDYNIESLQDIVEAAENIKSDFIGIALPYYKQNSDLESVEKQLNQRGPEGGYVPTTVSAACMGLIAAHLCGRSDLESLADFYISNIAKVQRKEFADPIVKVKEFFLSPKLPLKVGFGLPVLKPKP